MWAASISYLYGSNFFNPTSPERFAGSAYEAANGYATATGMTLKLYVPSRFYFPGIPGIEPLPDVGEPGYDPTLFFKAKFFNGENLVETWPGDYML